MISERRRIVLVGAFLLLSTLPSFAQDFPAKALHFIVPAAPGASADIIARLMAPGMSRFLGQPVVVENKPGAGQVIGFEQVARQAPPDGYSFVITAVANLAGLPLVSKDMRFDPIKELTPLFGAVESRLFFGSPSNTPWTSVEELAAYGKAQPGRLNYGSISITNKVYSEALARSLGINVTEIPFSNFASMMQTLAGGEGVHMAFLGDGAYCYVGSEVPRFGSLWSPKTRCLANVPTFSELRMPLQSLLYSLHVRTGTPRSTMERLHAAAASALQQPEVRAQFDKLQIDVVALSPEATARNVDEAVKLHMTIARQIGLEPK